MIYLLVELYNLAYFGFDSSLAWSINSCSNVSTCMLIKVGTRCIETYLCYTCLCIISYIASIIVNPGVMYGIHFLHLFSGFSILL
jgi:hypothetical protein